MRRNVSGQFIGCQLVSKTDGSAVTTGTTTVYVTGDAGTQSAGSVGSGACTHEGQGFWTYAPAQAETNYTHVAFTFVNTSACNVTVQVFPTSYDASGRYDIGMFGGTAGTFSGGRPEVNTTHWGGTAVASAVVSANTIQISGDSVAADNAEAFFDGTGYAGTNNVIPTVTTVTNVTTVNGLAANVITAASMNADASAEIADAVWEEAQADHVAAGSFGVIASEIADILVDTAEIGAAGAGLTNINLPDQTMNITGNITGNLSGSVGSVTAGVSIANGAITTTTFGAGAIDAAAIAANAIGASELAADAAEEIADTILGRNVAGGSNTGRLVKEALYALRNKVAITAGTMTVYQTDDTTSSWTGAVSTTAGDPISTIDPA